MRFIGYLAFSIVTAALNLSSAQTIRIDLDIRDAQHLLALACSGDDVDAAAFRDSPRLAAQLGHHRSFGEQYTLENYMAGVQAIARCEVPDPDPFRFASLVERRDLMEKAVNYLAEHSSRLSNQASDRLQAYAPHDFEFEGSAVMVAASFSCGGFARDGLFFVDIPCVANDIEEEIEAVAALIIHETYHAMQSRFAFSPTFATRPIRTIEGAWEHMFSRLASEGTASHVGSSQGVTGSGRYSTFSRESTQRNFRQLHYNFRLFNYMMELIGADPDGIEDRYSEIYGLAFDGAFDQRTYNVGEQMAAEIEHSFGVAAIPCLLAQPPENFALAYDAATRDNDNLEKSSSLGPAAISAANHLAKERAEGVSTDTCW
jgi:hypothetical protein